ncbi:MAG: GNAT family N-acetyltransferase [Kofleriaceae bacterium]
MSRWPCLIPDALTTQRLQLRRLQRSDASQLCAAFVRSRDDLEEQLERADTIDAARAAIALYDEQFESARREGPVRFVYGLFDLETRALVGCGALSPTQLRAFNVGVWLDIEARGRGHATAAIAALTTVSFRWLGAERTEIWCDRENRRMAQIAERLGYTHEATLHRWSTSRSGELRDQMVWRLDGASYPTSTGAELAIEAEEPRAPVSISEGAWTRMAAHLRAHHAVVGEADRACELAVDVVFASGKRHVQPVLVEQGTVSGNPWLMVRAPVGPEALLEAREAMLHNATLAAGALTLENGLHVLRHGAAPDEITPRGVDRIISMLAHEATRLRERDRADLDAHAQAFAGYIE